MKKSLIALVVMAASGVASVQSIGTLYGLVDASAGSFKFNNVSQAKVEGGGFQTSLFGLKGSENLGGSLKAIFALETGFGIDTGSSTGYTNVAGITSAINLFSLEGTKTNEWLIGADFPASSALTLSAGYTRSKDNDMSAIEDTRRTSLYAGFQTSKHLCRSG